MLLSGMRAPGWYAPVPHGLELRVAEKLERLRSLEEGARDSLA
jgi:putative ATPase